MDSARALFLLILADLITVFLFFVVKKSRKTVCFSVFLFCSQKSVFTAQNDHAGTNNYSNLRHSTIHFSFIWLAALNARKFAIIADSQENYSQREQDKWYSTSVYIALENTETSLYTTWMNTKWISSTDCYADRVYE